MGVLEGALVFAGMGTVSTSLERVRGRAPPPFSPVAALLFVTGTPGVPFVRLSVAELDSPASPFTLIDEWQIDWLHFLHETARTLIANT